MENNKMWAFLIHLSCHFWSDENSPPIGLYMDPSYQENNNVDLVIWDKTVRSLPAMGINTLVIDLGDAVQYETHPEIAAPDAWSKDFLKQKLDEIRALGMTPIPKLNFSACHDAWMKEYNRMISTPTYYQVCADLIQEVCELFGYPKLFHLGMDEETDRHQRDYGIAVIRHDTMWYHDVSFFCRECEKHGARPWIWSDYIWHHPESFAKNMPKSVLQSNWYYSPFEWRATEECRLMYGAYDLLDKLGYEQVPTCSTWATDRNIHQTLGYCKDRLNPDRLLGFMDAQWFHTKPGNYYALISGAERLYTARKYWYPETL